MKKIILFGNSDFAKLMKWYIETDAKRVIDGVTVDKDYITNPYFEGIPIVPFQEIANYYNNKEYEILIAVGYNRMNTIRKNIFERCKSMGYSVASFIHSSAIISSNAIIGEGTIILEDTLIQPFVNIGCGNIIWHKVAIAHNAVIGNFNTITGMVSLCGYVKIGDNCFIGSNSTIRNNVTISDYTLVGAGSYIFKNTEKYSVYKPVKCQNLNISSMDINI